MNPYNADRPERFGREPKYREGLRAVELFAGVGGFRLGLRKAGWCTVWSNQWEPHAKTQYASNCYVARFGRKGHVCEDIAKILDQVETGTISIPEHDLVVGGFPCQDYSVAKTLKEAHGINGRKGVLWWEIYRFLDLSHTRRALFENVDRLLKSPAYQRGRDFAVMLASLARLGYTVEWRVINAADYGLPQRRRRVFIVAERVEAGSTVDMNPIDALLETGVLARAFPVESSETMRLLFPTPDFCLNPNLPTLSDSFGKSAKTSWFKNAGIMVDGQVWTRDLVPKQPRSRKTLADIVQDDDEVPEEFYVDPAKIHSWKALKAAKAEPRRDKSTGFEYLYAEGSMSFPDPLDRPSRTILTGEGGSSPSRFKHIIQTKDGRYRRLTPIELERLNGFPPNWTLGMPDTRRAFCMGNALVVPLVARIAKVLADDVRDDT